MLHDGGEELRGPGLQSGGSNYCEVAYFKKGKKHSDIAKVGLAETYSQVVRKKGGVEAGVKHGCSDAASKKEGAAGVKSLCNEVLRGLKPVFNAQVLEAISEEGGMPELTIPEAALKSFHGCIDYNAETEGLLALIANPCIRGLCEEIKQCVAEALNAEDVERLVQAVKSRRRMARLAFS